MHPRRVVTVRALGSLAVLLLANLSLQTKVTPFSVAVRPGLVDFISTA